MLGCEAGGEEEREEREEVGFHFAGLFCLAVGGLLPRGWRFMDIYTGGGLHSIHAGMNARRFGVAGRIFLAKLILYAYRR